MPAKQTPVVISLELDDDVPTVPVSIAGEVFMLRQDINAFTLEQVLGGKVGALGNLILNLLIPEDQARFTEHMAGLKGLNETKLIEVFRQVLEVAAGGRPTNSSSGSRRTTPSKAAAKRSAAN